jgi:hypothetical protein
MNPIPNPIRSGRTQSGQKILWESELWTRYRIRRANFIFLFEYEFAFYPNSTERSNHTIRFNRMAIVASEPIKH